MNNEHIALQLYTLREFTASDMAGALREVGAAGYAAVELAGFGDLDAAGVREALEQYNVRAIAAHVSLDLLTNHTAQVIGDMRMLGCQYAVLPYVPDDQRQSVAQVRQLATTLNELGARLQPEGIQLGYHNHAFEFAPLEGTTMYDVLIERTDPGAVVFELDAYWAEFAGVETVGLLQRLAGRVPLLHAKDMIRNGETTDAPVGAGGLPWPAIYAAAQAAGTQWYIVEQDHPRDPWNDVRASLQYLQQL